MNYCFLLSDCNIGDVACHIKSDSLYSLGERDQEMGLMCS